jgi:thiol-disulfide isomerase/thioredoxin
MAFGLSSGRASRWTIGVRGVRELVGVVATIAILVAAREIALRPSAAQVAPAIVVHTLDGGKMELGGKRARPQLIDFWASWCPPCRETIPVIQAFARTHPDVDVVSVDYGEAPATAKAFATTHAMTNVVSDQSLAIATAFGAVTLPTLLMVDRSGRIASKSFGVPPNGLDAFVGKAAEH